MGKPLLMVGSITYAIKGRNILSRMGIRSFVERTPEAGSGSGCGYSIYVPDRADEAQNILSHYGVRVTGRAERGGGQ